MKEITIFALLAAVAFFWWKSKQDNLSVTPPLPTSANTVTGTNGGDCFAQASGSISPGVPECGYANCTNAAFSQVGLAAPIPLRLLQRRSMQPIIAGRTVQLV